jgi:outer membrane protein assembly factor BamD (BamD/ComL family)
VPAPAPNDEKPVTRHAERPRAGEDPSQVAEAVRALRKQGDPVRAQALLDQYLRQNPRGALSEDALALSIEAAAARKDPRAAEHARRYLARYPNGRFRALAERVLAAR